MLHVHETARNERIDAAMSRRCSSYKRHIPRAGIYPRSFFTATFLDTARHAKIVEPMTYLPAGSLAPRVHLAIGRDRCMRYDIREDMIYTKYIRTKKYSPIFYLLEINFPLTR